MEFADYIYMIKTALIKAFETWQQLEVDITPFNHAYTIKSFRDSDELSTKTVDNSVNKH